MSHSPRQRILAGLATALVLAGCGPAMLAPVGGPVTVGRFDSSRGAPGALYAFFALDNDLDHGSDLADNMVSAAAGTRNVAAAALYDGDERKDTTLFWGSPTTRASYREIAEVDSGTAAALAGFLTTATQEAPGRRRVLSMADHGGGIIRGICSDWNGPGGKKIIHVNEVAAALKATPVDIMMFDACFMNMAEVAYELKDVAKVVVGAQTTTRGDFPYNDLIALMDANATADNSRLAAGMTKTIAQNAYYSGVAFGAVDTSAAQAMAEAVARVSQAGIAAAPRHKKAILDAMKQATGYAAFREPGMQMYNDYRDFGSVMTELAKVPDPALQAAAQNARTAGRAAVLAGTAKSGDGLNLDNASGMALYAATHGYVEEKYMTKAWNRATKWGDFLVAVNSGWGPGPVIQRDRFPFAFPRPRAKK